MASSLKRRKIIITSGPTRADIDAVRFISNRSTGRLGSRIAAEALSTGAEVTFIRGPESESPRDCGISPAESNRLKIVPVQSVDDLNESLGTLLTGSTRYDAIVHAMAVLDYVPLESKDFKIRSGRETLTLELVRTPKVISRIKEWSPDIFLVGFKLETNKTEPELRDAASTLIRKTRADLAVANNLEAIRNGKHPAIIVEPAGGIIARPQTKLEIAQRLCEAIARRLR
jgi:phosphopantothenoylcysteine synthetase/decarboxylase